MNTGEKPPSSPLVPLTYAWLGLVALTVISLGLGHWFHGAAWLPLLVAAIVWLKGRMVARHFIEAESAHPFIRRVLSIFIAFTPLALVLLAFFGRQFARWTTL